MIGIAVLVSVLVVASASTWDKVGEKNIATLRQMNVLSQSMKGADVTPELMEQMSETMMAYFPAKMACHAAEVHLTDISPKECFLAVGQRMSDSGNVKLMNWDQTNLAIDPASGGKTILTYQPGELVGTSMGQILPGTVVGDAILNYKYEFNEEGLVKAFTMDFDSSVLRGVAEKVRIYNARMQHGTCFLCRSLSSRSELNEKQALMQQTTALETTLLEISSGNMHSSWKEVGTRNMATVQRLDSISKQLIGQHITPAAIAKLTEASQALYASRMTCVTAKGSGVGVYLTDVTHSECFQAIGKAWSNTRLVDFVDENLAIDPNTGGTTILTRMKSSIVGVSSAGQEVTGTSKNGMILNFRYKFNPHGLVSHFEQEYDTGIIRSVDMMVGQSEADAHLMSDGLMADSSMGVGFHFEPPGSSWNGSSWNAPVVLARKPDCGFCFLAIGVLWVLATVAVMATILLIRRKVQRNQPVLQEAFLG